MAFPDPYRPITTNPMPRRSRSVSLGAAGCIGLLIAAFGLFFLQALFVMLLWGAIGTTFWDTGQWRTIGYGTALLVTAALDLLGSFFRSASR